MNCPPFQPIVTSAQEKLDEILIQKPMCEGVILDIKRSVLENTARFWCIYCEKPLGEGTGWSLKNMSHAISRHCKVTHFRFRDYEKKKKANTKKKKKRTPQPSTRGQDQVASLISMRGHCIR